VLQIAIHGAMRRPLEPLLLNIGNETGCLSFASLDEELSRRGRHLKG
jgi:hypothetical protein